MINESKQIILKRLLSVRIQKFRIMFMKKLRKMKIVHLRIQQQLLNNLNFSTRNTKKIWCKNEIINYKIFIISQKIMILFSKIFLINILFNQKEIITIIATKKKSLLLMEWNNFISIINKSKQHFHKCNNNLRMRE